MSLLQIVTNPNINSSIIIGIISALGGGTIVKLFEVWMKNRRSGMLDPLADAKQLRKSLLKRIDQLEQKEKENEVNILELTKQNAALGEKVKVLEDQNEELKSLITDKLDKEIFFLKDFYKDRYGKDPDLDDEI